MKFLCLFRLFLLFIIWFLWKINSTKKKTKNKLINKSKKRKKKKIPNSLKFVIFLILDWSQLAGFELIITSILFHQEILGNYKSSMLTSRIKNDFQEKYQIHRQFQVDARNRYQNSRLKQSLVEWVLGNFNILKIQSWFYSIFAMLTTPIISIN